MVRNRAGVQLPRRGAVVRNPLAKRAPDHAVTGGAVSLDDLMAEAETFGLPTLYKTRRGLWSSWIDFNTIGGTELKANHPGFLPTAARSLAASIDSARKIKDQFK